MNHVQTNVAEVDLTIPPELLREPAKKGEKAKVQVAEDLNSEVLAAPTKH